MQILANRIFYKPSILRSDQALLLTICADKNNTLNCECLLVLTFLQCDKCSDGLMAYHWSQFNIPETKQEFVPLLTEERVVEALRRSMRAEGRRTGIIAVTDKDITASRKMFVYHIVASHFSSQMTWNVTDKSSLCHTCKFKFGEEASYWGRANHHKPNSMPAERVYEQQSAVDILHAKRAFTWTSTDQVHLVPFLMLSGP